MLGLVGPPCGRAEVPEILRVEPRARNGIVAERKELHPRDTAGEDMGVEADDRLVGTDEHLVHSDVQIGIRTAVLEWRRGDVEDHGRAAASRSERVRSWAIASNMSTAS